MSKVKHLVVDANAFLHNLPLWDMGEEIYTIREVVSEIRDSACRQRMNVLPYEINYREPSTESIQLLTKMSKSTGDYPSLSAVDIKLMALTYELTQEKLGPDASSFLKTEPETIRRLTVIHGPSTNQSERINEEKVVETKNEEKVVENRNEKVPETGNEEKVIETRNEPAVTSTEDTFNYKLLDCIIRSAQDIKIEGKLEEWEEFSDSLLTSDEENDSSIEEDENISGDNEKEEENDSPIKEDENISGDDENEEESDNENENEEENDSDNEGWITPSNFKEKIREMTEVGNEVRPENLCVACVTSDFAMQNVMLHVGLKVLSKGGMLIKHLKTFILRCYSCFRTTSIMTKVFCPSCGNKTLKKVSVSYNEDGTQVIHLSKRINITGRGKRFPLPTPQGGKHANNPILTEDQKLPQQRPTKLALKRNNPLSPDYIAGANPFSTKDVYSRAAMLGINTGFTVTNYWDKKNPNAARRSNGGGRKKKNVD